MLIQSEFYLSAGVTKCKQKNLQIVGNSLPHAPSRVRRSEKNRHAAEEES